MSAGARQRAAHLAFNESIGLFGVLTLRTAEPPRSLDNGLRRLACVCVQQVPGITGLCDSPRAMLLVSGEALFQAKHRPCLLQSAQWGSRMFAQPLRGGHVLRRAQWAPLCSQLGATAESSRSDALGPAA